MNTSKAILLIGGSGFIGLALAAKLRAQGRKVFTLSRSVVNDSYEGDHIVAQLDNSEILKSVLPMCSTVVHVASDTTPGDSSLQPSLEVTSNLMPSLRLLEVLQGYPDVILIYVSTGGAIYGDCGDGFATEDMPVSPVSYYGAGKAALEKFIIAYTRQTGNRAIILRPSNVYGPGQKYRPGFGIIPTIFHHVLNRQQIDVWGDGQTVRDYLFIDDFAECCASIISNAPDEQFNIYNAGAGKGTSLEELFSVVEDVTGEKIKKRYVVKRGVDVSKIVLSYSALQKSWSWSPKTELYAGLCGTWQWFKDYCK